MVELFLVELPSLFVAVGPIKGAEFTDDVADIGIVDIAVDEIGGALAMSRVYQFVGHFPEL